MGAAGASDTHALRGAVERAYSAIAERPEGEHPFKVGRELAEAAGYAPDVLDRMPRLAVEAFAGVSWLPCFAQLAPGAHVLDLGSGSGMDSLLLAARGCSIVGVDFSGPMLERAGAAARGAAVANVEFRGGDAEAIPARDAEFDVAVANGIFNLNPGHERIFAELARVVRPDGQALVAELVLKAPLPESERDKERNWFA